MSSHPFLWGTATSSHQIEGGNTLNDWWDWEQKGKIDNGESSGRACDHWNLFREDLKSAAWLGCNSYRFSVEWSRVEPKPGEWNEEALDWYQELLIECEKNNLIPMLTLHHFTMPLWFSERGGFTQEDAPILFCRYVKKIVETFGSRVPFWITLNEPMALMVGQYLGGFFPPGKFSPKSVSSACRNMLRAHVGAYDLIHREITVGEGRWKEMPRQVGISHNLIDFQPFRRWHPFENLLSRIFRRFYNRSWLDAITGRKQHFGVTGMIPYPKPVLEALNRNTVDFMGINYYLKVYNCWRKEKTEAVLDTTLPIAIQFSKPGDAVSDLGWAVHPGGLGRMLRFVRRYNLPIYITENGIADQADKLRSQYLMEHLSQVRRAIRHGVDIRGYFHWSLLDNFEWNKGFAPRFGLFEVDYDSLTRSPRPSAYVYRDLIKGA